MEFPCIIQSINFGGLKVAYGIDKKEASYYGCYRSSYEKDLIGLTENFIPLTKKEDLAEHYKIIMKNLTK